MPGSEMHIGFRNAAPTGGIVFATFGGLAKRRRQPLISPRRQFAQQIRQIAEVVLWRGV